MTKCEGSRGRQPPKQPNSHPSTAPPPPPAVSAQPPLSARPAQPPAASAQGSFARPLDQWLEAKATTTEVEVEKRVSAIRKTLEVEVEKRVAELKTEADARTILEEEHYRKRIRELEHDIESRLILTYGTKLQTVKDECEARVMVKDVETRREIERVRAEAQSAAATWIAELDAAHQAQLEEFNRQLDEIEYTQSQSACANCQSSTQDQSISTQPSLTGPCDTCTPPARGYRALHGYALCSHSLRNQY